MTFGLTTLARLATLTAVVLAGACSSDDDNDGGTLPPANPAPTGLAAAATGQTTINVTWTAPTVAVTQFVLQRATGNGAFAEIARPAAAATSYADQGLTAGTQYRYRLAAVRAAGTTGFSTEATATTQAGNGGGGGNVVEVTTDITANTTWTSDKVYLLKGFRKVANGATLTIQAGTVIQGDFETVGSSLFVLRGARINAQGTAAAPIVFTSSRPVGQRAAGDWGGLIIIGNARINRSGTVNLEGTGTGGDNPLINYGGGDNDFDNSGTLRYVRVEYAGFGPAADAELNSFTFAAVGGQTTMEYLQVLNGLDDSFEWFGGNADAKYLVSYEAGDDHFDMSEGFRGRLQYLIAFQSRLVTIRPGAGNVASDPQAIENDGCGSNAGGGCDLGFNSTPLTTPVVANFTLVGTGPGVVGSGGGYGMVLRRGVGGHYVNGLIARFPNAAVGYRDAQTKQRETEGVFSLKNIYVAETATLFQAGQQTYGTPGDLEHAPAVTAASLFTALAANPTQASDLDWSLAAGAAPRTGGLTLFTGDLANRAAGGITGTAFRGAADPNGAKWWSGWTNYADN
ncbi:MAG TPA: fibronectin type III domain-containing protein [Gemmatimonadales bacterium]|nr:fibronectin type III domain-containing protein [Gemmatimonadales bacterium]